MQNIRKTEIRVGLVSLVAIILFVIGITLGKGYRVSVNHYLLKIKFRNSSSIQPLSPVHINGVKRGFVNSILNESDYVLIIVDLDDINDLKEDAAAKIIMQEITGGKKIEISPGKSKVNFNINNTINGTTAADLGDLVSMFGDIAADAKSVLKRIDTMSALANKIIGDDKFINQVRNTMENASQMTSSMNTLISGNMESLQTTIKNLKVLTTELKSTILKNEPKLDSIITKIDLTLNDTKKLMSNTNSTIIDADSLIHEFKKMAYELRTGSGFASKVIYDKDFSTRMDSTINGLLLLVNQIREHGINANVRLGGRP